MKKVLILLLYLLLLANATRAQDVAGISVPHAAIQDFTSRYPSITPKRWKEDKAGQYLAKFKLNHNASEAFYDKGGSWLKTEVHFKSSSKLPPTVKKALRHSDYASCRFDDIQETDSAGQKRFYVTAAFLDMHEEGSGDSEVYRLTISAEGQLLQSKLID